MPVTLGIKKATHKLYLAENSTCQHISHLFVAYINTFLYFIFFSKNMYAVKYTKMTDITHETVLKASQLRTYFTRHTHTYTNSSLSTVTLPLVFWQAIGTKHSSLT